MEVGRWEMPWVSSEWVGNRGTSRELPRFVLYVEGPRDRDILLIWARRLSPRLVRVLESSVVILGGRQPARARSHFRELLVTHPSLQGMCVLDRDDVDVEVLSPETDIALEFFTWSRRHIESYLLVRTAILRCLPEKSSDGRVTALVERLIPEAEDEVALKEIDAKRLLSVKGPLARGLGHVVRPSHIARAQRESELHSDVFRLIERLQLQVGLAPVSPKVFRKTYSRS